METTQEPLHLLKSMIRAEPTGHHASIDIQRCQLSFTLQRLQWTIDIDVLKRMADHGLPA